MTGTTFPVTINSQVEVNALYDTGATRSCMNYDTFFNLGLDIDDKPAPHVRTASGTDMGAISFTMLMFAINLYATFLPNSSLFVEAKPDPLFWVKIFVSSYCTGCEWTPHGMKRFTTHHKLILEIDEPEADQFFGVKKSVKIPPRHYGTTHIQCKDLKEAVMLWVDEALKRKCPSMWADTYYINPFKVSVATLTLSTTDSQVNQTHVDPVPMASRSEQQPCVAGVQVSTNPEASSDASDASVLSTQSTKNPVTIPYVIFNLSSDTHIYIPKGTIIAHPDGNEPEVDVIEVAETIEEAQETMQYRNHLLSRPWLPMPLMSDMICSPAEVKYHRRVELKDHHASADMKR